MENYKLVLLVIRASRPTFRNNFDKIAFAVHACFLSSGYVLTATGPLALYEDALPNSSTEEVSVDLWKDLDHCYAFVYANPEEGSKKVMVNCLVMDDGLVVSAFSEEFQLRPLLIKVGKFSRETGSNNFSDHYKNLEELVKILDVNILYKLDAGLKPRSSSTPRRIVYPPVNPIGDSVLLHGPGAGMYHTRVDDDGFPRNVLLGPHEPDWLGVGIDPAFPSGQQNPMNPEQDPHPDPQPFRRDRDPNFIWLRRFFKFSFLVTFGGLTFVLRGKYMRN